MSRNTVFVTVLFLAACAGLEPEPLEPSAGHLEPAGTAAVPGPTIPELVDQVPVLPEPQPLQQLERYTVVVNGVPVKELLFALARDARVNIDIHPGISGNVTINAVEQTLLQILDRIAAQVDLRYEYQDDNLVIQADTPYLHTYTVSYLNLARDTTGSVAVSTQIESGSGGATGGADFSGNTSTTAVTSRSFHRFWENLSQNIHAILGIEGAAAAGGGAVRATKAVIISPESGVVTVRATAAQHAAIQRYLDLVTANLQRQILIEATVVEVTLNDQFQAGINWESVRVATKGGFSIATNIIGTRGLTAAPPFAGTVSSLVLGYDNPEGAGGSNNRNISATLSLLREFGDTKVLSSPQLMVLNNHTAVLKVVENYVYFEVEQDVATSTVAGVAPTTATTTTAKTVPIGLIMTVTPQVNKDDVVTLNIRPTISTFVRNEIDPNPQLRPDVPNNVPVVRVREMESILRIEDRQIAVLGGLMQDTIVADDREIPFFSDIPLVGEAFKARDRRSQKSELVIFIRPVVIRNASLDGDLLDYRRYLDKQNETIDDVKPSLKMSETE